MKLIKKVIFLIFNWILWNRGQLDSISKLLFNFPSWIMNINQLSFSIFFPWSFMAHLQWLHVPSVGSIPQFEKHWVMASTPLLLTLSVCPSVLGRYQPMGFKSFSQVNSFLWREMTMTAVRVNDELRVVGCKTRALKDAEMLCKGERNFLVRW